MEQKIRRDRNMGDNLRKLRNDLNIIFHKKSFVSNFNAVVVTLAEPLMQNTKPENSISVQVS